MSNKLLTTKNKNHEIYSAAESNLFLDLILKNTLDEENKAIGFINEVLNKNIPTINIDELKENGEIEKFRKIIKAKWGIIEDLCC